MIVRDLLHPAASQLSAAAGMPAFPFLASYHGEFELVFTVAPAKIASMEARARTLGWVPIPVGVVEQTPGVRFGDIEIDAARVRNALEASGGNLAAYLKTLLDAGVP